MAATPPPKRPWWRNPHTLLAAASVSLGVLAVIAAIAYQVLKRPGDIHRGNEVTFTPKEPKPEKKVHRVRWPRFGYDLARTRFLAVKGIKPPFKRLWKYNEGPLLEFPPVYAGGTLYAVNNDGLAFALDANTGKVKWQRKIAALNASSPTYDRGSLYVVNLVPGQILKLSAKNGHTIWRHTLPGRAESSPLVVGNNVYFGDEDGELYDVNAKNGGVKWTATLAGAVKAAPAYDHGILFVGDYGGEMSAVNSHTGKIKWQAGSQGLSFSRTGQFYSTPAVAFGRVYVGNNDGRVYSFDEQNGTLAWSHSTGSYVYSGPTVANTPQTPPSVYVGSYDGNVYALDAKTGTTRWSQPIGPVIGSLSAIGNIVYVATFSGTTTYGFSMRNGHQVWKYDTGAYMPVISDGQRIFLTGYSSITALKPYTKGAGKHGRVHRAQQQKKKQQKQAQAAKQKHRSAPAKKGANKQGNKQAKGAPANAQQHP
jgi:outer membrane protein assembly factor BamB